MNSYIQCSMCLYQCAWQHLIFNTQRLVRNGAAACCKQVAHMYGTTHKDQLPLRYHSMILLESYDE